MVAGWRPCHSLSDIQKKSLIGPVIVTVSLDPSLTPNQSSQLAFIVDRVARVQVTPPPLTEEIVPLGFAPIITNMSPAVGGVSSVADSDMVDGSTAVTCC